MRGLSEQATASSSEQADGHILHRPDRRRYLDTRLTVPKPTTVHRGQLTVLLHSLAEDRAIACQVSTIAVRQSFAACLPAVLGLSACQASCVNDTLHAPGTCPSARKPAPKADPAARPPKPCRY